MKICRPALVGFVLALVAGGCRRASEDAPDATRGLRPVTLALNWFPEVEHGGFYAAQVHGFFRDEGLDVEILSGGPGAPVIQQVATGRCMLACSNADQVLLGRDQGAPVVAVMAAMQNSPHCIMVHRAAGIDSLQQLRGVTLAVGSGKPLAKYLLHKLGDAQLTIVPYQGNVGLFLQRPDVAQQAYVFSEPFVAQEQGGDPQCLLLSEIGFNPYASLLVVHQDLLDRDADLVARVVRASVRGWQQYLENPDRTNQHILQLNAELSPGMLAYGAREIRALCLPAGMPPSQLGGMSATRWEQLSAQLDEIDLLEHRDVWQQAFETRFVEREESSR
jgi:NitT/TauT family transport system substrate-binding protein